MKRLNGMDAMLLYSETPNLHTHTLKVAVIDPSAGDAEFNFEAFRRHLRRRLHLLEPLRYKLVDIPWRLHHPMWLEDCDVDLDYHLRRIQVPAPGGRRELDTVIGDGGVHAARPQPPVVGVPFRRRAGRRTVCPDRQGPPRPGRRRRLGQPAGPRDGPRRTHRPTSATTTKPPSRRRRRVCCEPPPATTSSRSPSCPGCSAMPPKGSPGCAAVAGSAAITPTSRTRSTRRRPSSTTWFRRSAGSPPPRFGWPTSKRPPKRWGSRSTTWCSRPRPAACGSCC